MTVPLGNPFALGQTAIPTSARTDRIAMGASFRPSAAALGIASGFLYGPAGTMGDLTLLTDTLLRVDPFVAVVQGTHAADQGQYIVPNNATRDLAVPAKDASLFRRALVVVRVADSFAAGVASSAATDGSWLEVIPGPLVASNPALPSMAAYANYLLAGELSIPSIASGLPVTLTKYNPRTTSRGGILPVTATDTTPPGFDEQYRSHPTLGLQRGVGGAWRTVGVVPVAAGDVTAPTFDGQARAHPTDGLQIGDGGAWRPGLRGNPIAAIQGPNPAQAIATGGALAAVTLATDIVLRGFTRANAQQIACTHPGWYRLWGVLQISGNATGRRIAAIALNGVTIGPSQHVSASASTNTAAIPSAPVLQQLAAGDLLSLTAFQDSGVALSIVLNASRLFAEYAG